MDPAPRAFVQDCAEHSAERSREFGGKRILQSPGPSCRTLRRRRSTDPSALAGERHSAVLAGPSVSRRRTVGANAVTPFCAIIQLDPGSFSCRVGVLADHHLFGLCTYRTSQSDHPRCPSRLRARGIYGDLSDPGNERSVHWSDGHSERAAARCVAAWRLNRGGIAKPSQSPAGVSNPPEGANQIKYLAIATETNVDQ